MKQETVTLIRRPYQEVVDDILTSLVGGVVNEPIIFDVKADLYPLAEPAAGIRGITGEFESDHHSFLNEVDFEFSEGDNAVVWLPGGSLPDDETTFHVDYFRQSSRSPLTDINVGSVTRTLGEAIGREIATVYQQINRAYLAGFIDTAEGKSLDLVVAILGVIRKTADFAEGLVTFFRDATLVGNINIPEATRLATAKGEVLFVTTQPRLLQFSQARIDVPVRAAEEFAGDAGLVGGGEISEMVQPLAGVDRVTNFEATSRAAEEETDEELRLRAKAVLRSLGKATVAALLRVIREERGKPLELWDPNGAPTQRSDPGTVALLVESEPESFAGLQGAVHETRAAGVLTTLVARYIFFRPRLTATLGQSLTAAGKEKVKEEIIAALTGYANGLTSGEAAEGALLLEAIGSVQEVADPKIVDVIAERSELSRPPSADLTDALVGKLVAAVAEASGDDAALHEGLTRVLIEEAPAAPSGGRIVDRSLVQSIAGGSAGAPASDEEIEAGEFVVSAQVDGEDWFVVLDMSSADIVLREGGDGD